MKAHTPSRVVALADVFQDRLDAAEETFSEDSPRTFLGFDSCQKLLDADVDAVVIASPPYYHPEQFDAAVDAGKHVYLEKSVAVDTSGALRVKATGEKADGRLTVLVEAFYESVVEGKQVNESAQGVEATLSAILGRTAAYRGTEYGRDEMIRENETLEL